MTISLIVAASENNAIGKDNKLLWNLPNDLKFFKNTTWGMPVIMGRKTYESLAGGPLRGRFNFVVTSRKNWNPGNDKVKVAATIKEAVELAKQTDCKEIFIVGGGQIYADAIKTIANKIYMTRVHASFEGDTFFPVINEDEWKLISNTDFPADEKNACAYSFQQWVRK
jgi:dihydrofolate reductase